MMLPKKNSLFIFIDRGKAFLDCGSKMTFFEAPAKVWSGP